MNKKSLILLFAIVILIGILTAFISISARKKEVLSQGNELTKSTSGENILEKSGENQTTTSGEINTSENISNVTPLVYGPIKAVYSTGWVAGTSSMRKSMIQNITNYNFNAVVLDIKDEAGHLSYSSNVQTAKDIKASKNMIKDIKAVLDEFHENNIYVIGRIVTFKDPTYAKAVKEIAYQKADGTYWTDSQGNYWPNPYNESSWDYPIALAKEAAELGFDEIQFDYIRFPSSEGRVKQISYGFDSATVTKSQKINKFLTRVMDEMAEYKIKISADVFGIITKRNGDFENIGQDFKSIASIVDVVCPMVYPSHYGYGEYKVAKPDLNPYKIIYSALSDAQKRITEYNASGEVIETNNKYAEIRPYLQDFTASWLGKGNYQVYGTNAVKDQIQACFDLGINGFTLWDPNNKYCYDALELASSGE